MVMIPFLGDEPLFWVVKFVVAASLGGVALMGLDKYGAGDGERVPEKVLWGISLVGLPGIIVGAIAFHNKTSKPSFWVIPAIGVVAWIWWFVVGVHIHGVLPAPPVPPDQ